MNAPAENQKTGCRMTRGKRRPGNRTPCRGLRRFFVAGCLLVSLTRAGSADFTTEIRQITFGPAHHFFGYIGQVRTIPWNASGRYIAGLRTGFQDRMPGTDDVADIVLVDTGRANAVEAVERTRAWNFQQGTMLCWNPRAAETQFFFNDRDPRTGKIFCVLYDVARRARVREFRFDDTPVGNGGVAQGGGWFCGINYGRLARLRPVTGYPGAFDWTAGVRHPDDDGVFRVDVATGRKQLLVSFRRLADMLRPQHPEVDEKELFINHTLCNRDDDRIYFYVRGDFEGPRERRLNVPMVMNADGSNLRALKTFIGGHPDWDAGRTMIGATDTDQILFDTDRMEIVGRLGTPESIPKPGGDIALSPDGRWFVNGFGEKGRNYYTILRRADGAWTRTAGVNQGGYLSGELRIDPAPCWNRDATQLLVPGVADDADATRQMFLIQILPLRKDTP